MRPNDQTTDAECDSSGQDERASLASGIRRLAVLLALVLLLIALVHFTPLGELWNNLDQLRAFVDQFGIRGEISFALLTATLMAVGTPRLIFFGLGGLLFGFWEGLAAALVGSMLGSWAMFRVIRWGGRRWVRKRFGEHRLLGRITTVRPTAMAVAMTRQMPLSNVLINVGLALSRVPSRAFLLGTFFGFLPQGVVACLIGSGLASADEWLGITQVALAALLAIALGAWAYRQRARRAPSTKEN